MKKNEILKKFDVISLITNKNLNDAQKIKFIEQYLSQGGNLDEVDGNGRNILDTAAIGGSLFIFKWLLNKCPNSIKQADKNVLFFALANSNEDIIYYLIQHFPELFRKEIKGSNVFHAAAMSSKKKYDYSFLIERAKELSMEWNVPNSDGNYPIHLAARSGNWPFIECMITNGVSVNLAQSKNTGNTSLNLAALAGQLHVCERLIQSGSDYNSPNLTGFYPIHVAAGSGKVSIVKLLLSKGVSIDLRTKNNYSNTPLDLAAQKGHVDVCKLLIECGADFNSITNYHAIHIAASAGNWPVIELLITKGTPIDITTPIQLRTALHLACERGHLELCKKLIEHGADVHFFNRDGCSAIHLAATQGHWPVIQFLSSMGVPVYQPTSDGKTALQLAIKQGHLQCVEEMLKHNAFIFTWFSPFGTPLSIAIQNGHLEIVKLLFQYEPMMIQSFKALGQPFLPLIKQRENDGIFPIHSLADLFNANVQAKMDLAVKILNELILHGQDITQNDGDNNSLLHLLCNSLNGSNAQELSNFIQSIISKFNINQVNKKGQTPLHLLCSTLKGILEKILPLFVTFIELGASLEIRDHAKETALEKQLPLFLAYPKSLQELHQFHGLLKPHVYLDDTKLMSDACLLKSFKGYPIGALEEISRFVLDCFPSRFYLFLLSLKLDFKDALLIRCNSVGLSTIIAITIGRKFTDQEIKYIVDVKPKELPNCNNYFFAFGTQGNGLYKKNTVINKLLFYKSIRSSEGLHSTTFNNEQLPIAIKVLGALLLSELAYLSYGEEIYSEIKKSFIKLLSFINCKEITSACLPIVKLVLDLQNNHLDTQTKNFLLCFERNNQFKLDNKEIPSLLKLCSRFVLRAIDLYSLTEKVDKTKFTIINRINSVEKNHPHILNRYFFWERSVYGNTEKSTPLPKQALSKNSQTSDDDKQIKIRRIS